MAAAIDAMTGVARRFTPDPAREAAYRGKFARFAATVAALGSTAGAPSATGAVEQVR